MSENIKQDLLRAAKAAYFRLLVLDSKTRHTSAEQTELCILRDSIADATGRTSEEVQNEFEERAVKERYGL